MKQALQDFNIEIETIKNLTKERSRPAELWPLIDPPISQNASSDLIYLQSNNAIILPFEVRYQLEVCISHELLNEYNIDAPFIKKLAEISTVNPERARNILEWVAKEDQRIYEPMTLFDNESAMSASFKTEIPHYCAYSRKATITPTAIYFCSPTVETTNRVLRHYARENADGRFLRVQFTDEQEEVCGLPNARSMLTSSRAESMHVQRKHGMMSCSVGSLELSSTASKLETGTTSSSPLAILSSVRMEPTSSAPQTTFHATISVNGWAISQTSRLWLSMLLDLANVSRQLVLLTGSQNLI